LTVVAQSTVSSGGYAIEVAKLILEYIKVLVWPAVALYVTLRYRRYFERFLDRFSSEATEVEAKFLGVSARLFQQISNGQVPEKSANPAAGDATSAQPSSVQMPADTSTSQASPATVVALDQVRVLADIFFSKPFKDRQAAAHEVQQYARLLRLSDILALATSPLPGERVAGGIAIREYLRSNKFANRSPEILSAIANGLRDPLGRVRYRFVRAAAEAPEVMANLRDHLEAIAASDGDAEVKKEAARVLGAA
jgi:hypothetical protein